MPLTTAQIATLKTELQTDPRGYGYNAANRNDSDIQEKVNRPRDGAAGNVPTTPTAAGGQASGVIRLAVLLVDTAVIRAVVTLAAYGGLVTTSQAYFNWLTTSGLLTVNANLLQSLAGIPTATSAIWAAADRTAMNAAMEALLRKNGSRAEELFGVGVVVTIDDVGKALN